MFRLTVRDVLFIHDRGLVPTGRVESGQLRVGDQVQVNGGQQVRVDGIEQFRKPLDEVGPGDNVGLLFRGLDKSELNRGDVLTAGGFQVNL